MARHPAFAPIHSARLTLRVPRYTDVPVFVRHLSDWDIVKNLAEVPFPYKTELGREFVKATHENIKNKKRFDLCVEDRASREVIGCIGYQPGAENGVGYWFAKHAWGHGYATEALGRWIEYIVGEFHPPYLTADVNIDNEASKRVLEKNGFIVEGQAIKKRPASGILVKVYNLKLPLKEAA